VLASTLSSQRGSVGFRGYFESVYTMFGLGVLQEIWGTWSEMDLHTGDGL
jgi:hypothetical protein